jgi:hypothetical protein
METLPGSFNWALVAAIQRGTDMVERSASFNRLHDLSQQVSNEETTGIRHCSATQRLPQFEPVSAAPGAHYL